MLNVRVTPHRILMHLSTTIPGGDPNGWTRGHMKAWYGIKPQPGIHIGARNKCCSWVCRRICSKIVTERMVSISHFSCKSAPFT